ncbi:uncharacterized protein EI97DRAFT_431486 [Westerdykella ornata]|uniref:DUF7892 domain-containing protein n=1 Tax=Westerdykella ornata TaxID=318751 RepID=A0A6A6JNL6_WESOR|nr:uncharacterized protein EI97DRAFT_431486 [Westerdykella ornata]KAF2278220.1 hypothetical protein EI97DRAFT_431486 [Westerdykella ornata]
MDERETSVSSSSDFYGSDQKSNTRSSNSLQPHLPTKRKAEEAEVLPGKKQKLDSPLAFPTTELLPCAGLPPAVWQHIFLFCPLKTLGRLLQVNRSFHFYLTEIRDAAFLNSNPSSLRLLKSESIWASARNMHPTKPPKPLPGFTEIDMWRLVWSKTCQFCQKPAFFTPGEKIWQRGPGPTGVRVIWPFGIRACGSCVTSRCQTDASLLFSNASALRPALPFALITSDANYIPAYTLQAATTPAHVEISKYYYKPHVVELTEELERALSLGPAAAEEWYKGLEVRGKDRMKCYENWERWEVKYQWWEKHQATKTTPPTTSLAPRNSPRRRLSPSQPQTSAIIHAPVPVLTSTPHPPTSKAYALSVTNTPLPAPTVGAHIPRGERNLHDAIEAKANRKLEIERRAMLLDPPIPPTILRHMESFKAAIQISQPLNDYAWSMLYPRLLAQLPEAQQAELEHSSRLASANSRVADRRLHDPSAKELKDALDREWEELQRPVRDKLNALADDIINQDWDRGRAVTLENSPNFAADLLVNIRRRYYAEVGEGAIPSNTQNSDPSIVHGRRRLVLENMKWVYDHKLKPLTEQFRKELFLCNGSGCEGNPRFYGFEGVIQHFAAKHTNAFSRGNIVVAWRDAEWPEETPFHPDPISVKNAHHHGSYHPGYGRPGTVTPHNIQSTIPKASPSPYIYSSQFPGPFPPPNLAPQAGSGDDDAQPYAGSKGTFLQPQIGPPEYAARASMHGQIASPSLGNRIPVSSANHRPTSHADVARTHDPGSENNPSGREIRFEAHRKQVSTIIQAAQKVWRQTSAVHDIPNGLRLYVLLHHVISRSRLEFHHELTWAQFRDAFLSPEMPSAIKYASGLFCKACGIASPPRTVAPSTRLHERTSYSSLDLLRHFESQHMTSQDQGHGSGQVIPLDWKEDMIEIPSGRFISDLIHNPRMDDETLHLFAAVFTRRFPSPLPRTGGNHGISSYLLANTIRNTSPLPRGLVASLEHSGPSPLDPHFTDSPEPPKPSQDEYDPHRPALVAPARPSNSVRMPKSRRQSPVESLARHEGEYVYRPYAPMDEVYNSNYQSTTRNQISRDHDPAAREAPMRYAVYTGYEDNQDVPNRTVAYARPHDSDGSERYLMHAYQEHDHGNHEIYTARGAIARPRSHVYQPYEADRLHEATGPMETPVTGATDPNFHPQGLQKAVGLNTDPEHELGISPKPTDRHEGRFHELGHRKALSAASNDSDRGERVPGVPTSNRTSELQSRNDRHGYVPARYYRYMKVVRDDPYGRGSHGGRSQNKRYERYEEQQRRFEQEEIPSGHDRTADRHPENPTVRRMYPAEPYTAPLRRLSREHLPHDNRTPPPPPPRHPYTRSPEHHGGPSPVYYDQYGRPLYEYEIVHVADDSRLRRPLYPPESYYVEHDSGRPQLIAWDVPPPRHQSRGHEYVYYEDRGHSIPAGHPVPDPHRKAAVYDPPPPEIKVECGPALGPEGPP